MLRYLCLLAGLFLGGCGGIQVTATSAREETGVTASCAAVSPAEQFAGARLVFVGRMLPGPTTSLAQRRVLGSPARVRVERYLKGHGPRTVNVRTAVTIQSDATTVAEDGIEPRPGERWKIYTDSRRQPFDTSICAGSRREAAVSPALALWRAFPVDANPRPIVPLAEGLVLDPQTGFQTGAQKLAYLEGRFTLGTELPPAAGTAGGFPVVSAAAAYGRLRAQGNGQHDPAGPLTVTRVSLASAEFVTDREHAQLPAWQFFFKDVSEPASVLAVAPPDVFTPPPLHRFGPPGPGNSIEDSARASAGGRTITLSFIGAHAGTAPCDASYRATAVADQRAVAFTITARYVPVPPGEACAAVGYTRTAVLHLSRPLGARVLISATDGGAVQVTSAR